MRHSIKKCIYVLIAATTLTTYYTIAPYYSIRSQGVNAAHGLAGMSNHINLAPTCDNYGAFYGGVEYTRSFKPRPIARCLFGNDIVFDPCTCDPALVISGSQTTNRGATDWLADYFGLPTDFKSIVSFRPLIQNVIIDFGFYCGLDQWREGLYFQVDAPIAYTKWSTRISERLTGTGKGSYPAGYFSASTESNLNKSFTSFITGNVPTFSSLTVNTDPQTVFPASVFDPLSFGKIATGALSKAGLAELRAAVGWNWARDCYHVGANLRFAAPTGTRPRGIYLFEPIVGNGHHWELGVGITGHYDFYVNDCNSDHAGVYFVANITHLFDTCQRRTFDLKNKPNSRYMLAEKLGSATVTANPPFPVLTNPPFPTSYFQNEFSPVANLTTFNVNVSANVQVDFAAMLNYTSNNWAFDLGYNLWYRSCEKIKNNCCPTTNNCNKKCPPIPPVAVFAANTWALKGDASVIGFADNSSALNPTFPPVALGATESNATIHAGTNFPSAGTTDSAAIIAARANPNINSPAFATAGGLNVTINQGTQGALNPQTRSSTTPVFISLSDVDCAGTTGLSNKLFTNFSYTWFDTCTNWTPYFGFGAEVEWGNSSCPRVAATTATSTTTPIAGACCPASSCSTSCSSSCNNCAKCTLSQWGVWVKGGVNFN